MKQTIPNIADAQSVLKDYVNFLKVQLKVTSSTNFSQDHNLKANKNTRGITEYWKDEEQFNWKIKGWTDSKFISVLLAYSKKELAENTVNPFLDGLLFKGM
jgi:Fe-S-cluster formation regulator IscX/YfhJ